MKWEKYHNLQVPIKSWCHPIEDDALKQAENLANHPVIYKHVALMPDCHVGYGMPIGGVAAFNDAIVPNAVGVDIGCGMGAVQTDYPVDKLTDKKKIREIIEYIKTLIPVGEGHAHRYEQQWKGFNQYLDMIDASDHNDIITGGKDIPAWLDSHGWKLDKRNLGTLGGGNHFIEIQKGNDGFIWLMLHSGSRNLGHRIASYYHKKAMELNGRNKIALPHHDLAYLPITSKEGQAYLRDMTFALNYAKENRRIMMNVFKETMCTFIKNISFTDEINIHHNYADNEKHFNRSVWVHRKGATSAKKDEPGIIPGSMGTASYIIKGKGNPESFMSCSHGAGRVMGRMEACRTLTIDECDKAMEGVVFDRWKKLRKWGRKSKGLMDLGESPLAYKNIDTVIEAELDLITPMVKLYPLGVIKG